MERILLYALALVVGLRLLMPANGQTDGSELDRPSPDAGVAALLEAAGEDAGTQPQRSLTLVDRNGESRILLSVGDDGTPSLMLRSPSGKVAMRLAVEADETAVVELGEGTSHTSLRQEADGQASLKLRGPAGMVTVGIDEKGETSLSLNRKQERLHARLVLTERNEAQLHLGPPGAGSGVTVGWAPSGDAYISVLQADGKTGPVVQSFKDGLAQVAINAGSGDAGPSMLMTPDGVAIMSVRLPNGQPGASLLASKDGHSVVAAASPDGRKRAEMRAYATEEPTIRIIDPDAPMEEEGNEPEGDSPRKPGPRVDSMTPHSGQPVAQNAAASGTPIP